MFSDDETEEDDDRDESDISDSERGARSYHKRLSSSSDHQQRLSNSDRMIITYSDDDEGLNTAKKSGWYDFIYYALTLKILVY